MGTWFNNDGLQLKFGTDKTKVNPIGEFRSPGSRRWIEIKFDYTMLPAVASNSVIISEDTLLPVGAVVESVEIFTVTDWDSAADAMTLNVGWLSTDHTTTTDVDAFVVAATQAELITGGTNVAGWVGAEVGGTPLTAAKLLTWEVDVAAATAGEGYIRIYYNVFN